MKKIVIPLLLLVFVACKKESQSTIEDKNTVTYTSNGKTYTVSEKNSNTTDVNTPPLTYVDCFVDRSDNFTRFWLQVQGSDLPFNLLIDSFDAPSSGIGTFNLDPGDCSLQEKFSGAEHFTIGAGVINITEASSQRINGKYSFRLENASSTKTVTGTFIINSPVQ